MAHIICPECGRMISDQSAQCIHCGCPIEEKQAEPKNISLSASVNTSAQTVGKSNPALVSMKSSTAKAVDFAVHNILLTVSLVVIVVSAVIGVILAANTNSIVGDYRVVYADIEGTILDEDTLEYLNSSGNAFSLSIRNDMTATTYLSGTKSEFTVDKNYFIEPSGIKHPYTFSDGRLTLKVKKGEGVSEYATIVFEKK